MWQTHGEKRGEDTSHSKAYAKENASLDDFAQSAFGARGVPCTAFRTKAAEASSFALIFPHAITEAADGFNRVTGFSEFFAQAAYVRVHRACIYDGFVAPNLV